MADKFKEKDIVVLRTSKPVVINGMIFTVKSVLDNGKVVIEFALPVVEGISNIITLIVDPEYLELVT